MAPLAAMNKMSLTRRRKLALSAFAGAAALFALFRRSDPGMEFDPERDLYSTLVASGDIEPRGLGSNRALANTVDDYDTDQSVPIPQWYEHCANVWDPLVVDDQPFLWYVPRAGANTMSKVMSRCLEFVSANSFVGMDGTPGATDTAGGLQIKTLSDGGRYINCDMSDVAGINQCATWNLVSSNQADIITASQLRAAMVLFNPPEGVATTHKGRLFVMIRHPVKRAVDLFFYRQKMVMDPKNFLGDGAAMTLMEYARSPHHVENYLVRSLVGRDDVAVTAADVETAKHILRRKFMVGITEERFFDVSVVRFEKYFGWWEDKSVMTNMTVNHCHHKEVKKGGHFGTHPKFKIHSKEHRFLAARNWADMELYMWAKKLFKRQAVLAKRPGEV